VVTDAIPDEIMREVERLAGIIGYHMAAIVSRNNQPCMSGDPRDRIPQALRREFDRACFSAADAILTYEASNAE